MAFKDDIMRQMNAVAEGVRNPPTSIPGVPTSSEAAASARPAVPPASVSFADLQRAMGARPTGEVLGQFNPTDPTIGMAKFMPSGYSITNAGTERAGIRGQIPPWRPEVGNDAIKQFVGGDKNLARAFNAYPSPAQAQAGYQATYSEPSLAQVLYGNPNARASGPVNFGTLMNVPNFTMNGPASEVPQPSRALTVVPEPRQPSRALTVVPQPPNFTMNGPSSEVPQPTMGDRMATGNVPKGNWWESMYADARDRVTQPNPGAPQGINLNDKDFRVAGGLANVLNGIRSGRGLGVAGGIATLAGVGKEIYDERNARLAEQARPYTLDTPRTGDVTRTVAEDMARRVGPMGLALAGTSTPAAAASPTTPPGNGPLYANFANQPVNMAMARPSEPTGLAGISSEEPATTQGGVAPGQRGDLNLSGRPFAEAYAIARKRAAELGAEKTGQFIWNGQAYQTNRAPARGAERYIPASQQTKLGGLPTLNESINSTTSPQAQGQDISSQGGTISGSRDSRVITTTGAAMPGGTEPIRVFEEQGIGLPDLEYAQRHRDPRSYGNNAGLIIGGPLDRLPAKDVPPELRVPVPGGNGAWTKPTSATAEDIYMEMHPEKYMGTDVYGANGKRLRNGANSQYINMGQVRPPADWREKGQYTYMDQSGQVRRADGEPTPNSRPPRAKSAMEQTPGTFMADPVGYTAKYDARGHRHDYIKLSNGTELPAAVWNTLNNAQTQARTAATNASKGLTPQQQNAQTQGRLSDQYAKLPRSIANASAELEVLRNQLRAQGKSDAEINASREVQTHQANIELMKTEMNTIEKRLKMPVTKSENFPNYGEE